jgi:hypothetical protein
MVPLTAPLFRVIFLRGAYLPQKLDLLPPLERERNSVQKHVSSYYIEISPGCFVWGTPTLLRGRPYLKNEENTLRGANTVVDSNPARVKARDEVHTRSILILYT